MNKPYYILNELFYEETKTIGHKQITLQIYSTTFTLKKHKNREKKKEKLTIP